MMLFDGAFFCENCEAITETAHVLVYICDGTGELECEMKHGLLSQVCVGSAYVFGVTRWEDTFRIDVACEDYRRAICN
jgi:hypothetical protein